MSDPLNARKLLAEAFPFEPVPAHVVDGAIEMERFEAWTIFSGRRWDELNCEELSATPTVFFHLNSVALGYYFPGLLLSVFLSPNGFHEDPIIRAFGKSGLIGRTWITRVSSPQKIAICAMLIAIGDIFDEIKCDRSELDEVIGDWECSVS